MNIKETNNIFRQVAANIDGELKKHGDQLNRLERQMKGELPDNIVQAMKEERTVLKHTIRLLKEARGKAGSKIKPEKTIALHPALVRWILDGRYPGGGNNTGCKIYGHVFPFTGQHRWNPGSIGYDVRAREGFFGKDCPLSREERKQIEQNAAYIRKNWNRPKSKTRLLASLRALGIDCKGSYFSQFDEMMAKIRFPTTEVKSKAREFLARTGWSLGGLAGEYSFTVRITPFKLDKEDAK